MAIGTNIPAVVIKKLVPLLIKQLEGLSDVGAILQKLLSSLPPNVACNDPIVQNIKANLEKVKKLIDNIRKILTALDKIRKALNITAGVANTIQLVQMVLPLPPFAPPGPISKLLTIVIGLGANCKSALECLNGLLASAELAIASATDIIADASTALSNICTEESITVTRSTARIIAANINRTAGINSGLGDGSDNDGNNNNNNNGTSSPYGDLSSIFYTKFNVSKDDLDKYEEDVNSLVAESKDILTNLIEAPSAVYIETDAPTSNVGNTGDYYIDIESQIIYGPKVSDKEWGIGTKY